MKYLLIAKAFDKRNRLISTASNSFVKSHPLQKKYAELAGLPMKDKLHAEVACILRCKDTPIHRLTVERYGKSGNMLLAKPCPICQLVIADFGIKVIEYTTEYGWEYL